ncbi:hypothetical protein [Breznakia pachnodae]|uniref:YopX protein domain-containing protein n=1 Tax=Breznakia pachnodae TaxID=265178 RepID=A0ABU0DZE7_9FIRM|nr:hypothetical protein [Breznakia pachnodae]MDQ0360010.1 hypothetical protein [Breznakia pachnodae]
MKKLTLKDLKENYQDWTSAVIVFKQESYENEYSEKSRSYAIWSDDKYFQPSMLGNSLFGSCLDGTDQCVRLNEYLIEWIIDYCYITESHGFKIGEKVAIINSESAIHEVMGYDKTFVIEKLHFTHVAYYDAKNHVELIVAYDNINLFEWEIN